MGGRVGGVGGGGGHGKRVVEYIIYASENL